MGDDTQMMLGRLAAQMEALSETVKEHRAESRDGRKIIYDRLDSIELKASHTERSVSDMREWKDTIAPEIATIQKWRERGIGAWMVIVFVSGIAGAFLMAGWKWVLARLGLQ
jgi:hypothetical protein